MVTVSDGVMNHGYAGRKFTTSGNWAMHTIIRCAPYSLRLTEQAFDLRDGQVRMGGQEQTSARAFRRSVAPLVPNDPCAGHTVQQPA